MAQKPGLSPEANQAVTELDEAAQKQAEHKREFDEYKAQLDALLARPTWRQSDPGFLVEKASVEATATEKAVALMEVRREVADLKVVVDEKVATEYKEKSTANRARLHELATKLDPLLTEMAEYIGEAKVIFRDQMTLDSSAGMRSHPNPQKAERNLATVIVNKLGIAELRRLTWTVPRHFQATFSELWPNPEEVE